MSPAWLVPATGQIRADGDLGVVFRSYCQASGLSQQQLAGILGYDRTYITMIESGRRRITDRGTLARIARALAIPPHVLGIADPDGADFASVLALGASVIRLATIARHNGQAATAAGEPWPLIASLESRVAGGHTEPAAMSLLAEAQVSFGVTLGHLLPEERMAAAAAGLAGRCASPRISATCSCLPSSCACTETSCARPAIRPLRLPGSSRPCASTATLSAGMTRSCYWPAQQQRPGARCSLMRSPASVCALSI
jgi:transcriptional regulator with XRE-family HTH domain